MPSGNASWAAILHPLGASSHLTIIPSRSLASRLPVSSGSKSVAPTTLPFPFARKQFCGAKEHGSTKDSGSCGEIDGSGDKFVIHDVDPYGVTRDLDLPRAGWRILLLRNRSILRIPKCCRFPVRLVQNVIAGRPSNLRIRHRSQLVSFFHPPKSEHLPREYRTPRKMLDLPAS